MKYGFILYCEQAALLDAVETRVGMAGPVGETVLPKINRKRLGFDARADLPGLGRSPRRPTISLQAPEVFSASASFGSGTA
jgi:hypothetical protein